MSGSNPEKLIKRYREARKEQQLDEQMLKLNLLFGAGLLMGGDYPGASAGVILALERLFPDEKFPNIGGDDTDPV